MPIFLLQTKPRSSPLRFSATVMVAASLISASIMPVALAAEKSSKADEKTSTASVSSDSRGGGDNRFIMPHLQKDVPLLRGEISTYKGRSPIIPGTKQEIPKNTKIDLVVPDGITINSELSQKGDEVMVRIAEDITSGGKVIVPGGWYMRGLVTDAQSQKRLGRDGYVEVQIDKLVSPDGDYEIPFEAKFSTKDKKLQSVAKIVGTDAKYVGVGGAAGALFSLQVTGVPGAIATHGYSVAGGAAIGGTIGLIGALKRKGAIRSLYSGDSLKLVTDGPVTLPAFDQELLPSKQPVPHLEGLDLTVKNFRFAKTDWGDKDARILALHLDVENKTERKFHFHDLEVISDRGTKYSETPFNSFAYKNKDVAPGESGSGVVTFLVGSPKRKYYLIFISRRTGKELTRVAIN